MIALTLNIKRTTHAALCRRAERAQLSLPAYIVAAALDPLKYAWHADVISKPASRQLRKSPNMDLGKS